MSLTTHRATVIATCLALLALPAAVLAQSPGASAPGAPPAADGLLRVADAWVRPAPMTELADAAFMVISNDGTADDALVGASTPVATTVELHQTTTDASGVMAMAPVQDIPVPAGGSVELAPGGFHMMLIGLVQPLAEGDVVPLTLTFASGATVDVTASVSGVGPIASGMPMASPMPMGSQMPMTSPGM